MEKHSLQRYKARDAILSLDGACLTGSALPRGVQEFHQTPTPSAAGRRSTLRLPNTHPSGPVHEVAMLTSALEFQLSVHASDDSEFTLSAVSSKHSLYPACPSPPSCSPATLAESPCEACSHRKRASQDGKWLGSSLQGPDKHRQMRKQSHCP